MGLAFGGKELVFEEDPNLNLRKVHYRLIRDKGLSLVSLKSTHLLRWACSIRLSAGALVSYVTGPCCLCSRTFCVAHASAAASSC